MYYNIKHTTKVYLKRSGLQAYNPERNENISAQIGYNKLTQMGYSKDILSFILFIFLFLCHWGMYP